MNLLDVGIFDIKGDYAYFRAYETTRGNFSFSFPPRTAILGLLASILGINRNEYWVPEHPLFKAKIGIEVLTPTKRIGVKMNYIQSRMTMHFADMEILLPRDPSHPDSRGFSTQVRLDLLKDVAFRIYFSIDHKATFLELCNCIANHLYTYPPYLGHANLLCTLHWMGKFPFQPLNAGTYKMKCLIPTSSIDPENINLKYGAFSVIYNVPTVLLATPRESKLLNRQYYTVSPARFENVIFQVAIKQTDGIEFEIPHDNVVYESQSEDYQKRIVFFPTEPILPE